MSVFSNSNNAKSQPSNSMGQQKGTSQSSGFNIGGKGSANSAQPSGFKVNHANIAPNQSRPDFQQPLYRQTDERFNTGKNSVDKPYAVHNSIQVHSNVIQKLYASSSDLANNQKLLDVSDSDYRMLPLKFAWIAGKYALLLKVCFLIFFGVGLVGVIFPQIPIFFAYVAGSLCLTGFIYWGTYLLYLSKQYVIGDKTGKYFRGMLSGWRAFESSFLFLVAASVFGIYFFTKNPTFIQESLVALSKWRIGTAILSRADAFTGLLIHTFIFVVASSVGYFIVSSMAKREATRLQSINKRNMDIDQNREEVADIILKGGYGQ